MSGVWVPQGDWQVGWINREWVVLARGGTFSTRRLEDLALHVVATCRDDIDAERIVAALRLADLTDATHNETPSSLQVTPSPESDLA